MNKYATIAVVQPPVPDVSDPGGYLLDGKRQVVEAAEAGADFICLPEYFGVFGVDFSEWRELLVSGDPHIDDLCGIAEKHGVALIYPSVELSGDELFNTAYLIDSHGEVAGKYRKTHLTLDERARCGLTPGSELPVFELDGVSVAVMTCYDGYFPEVARVLTLKGAKIIFWPSLQRGSTEDAILVQARSRAMDNCVFIARSSYGHPNNVPWKTGMMPGASCVVDREGRVMANAGIAAEFAMARVDARNERPKPRSFGAAPALPSEIMREDRRPELYSALTACGDCNA